MRNRKPPEGLDLREWWFATTLARRSLRRNLPFRSVEGAPFTFSNVDAIQKIVHRIDQQASGQILSDDVSTNSDLVTGTSLALLSKKPLPRANSKEQAQLAELQKNSSHRGESHVTEVKR